MITKLVVNNFRAFKHASVSLERLTLIVGPNASGKSSVLSAIHAGCQFARPGKDFSYDFSNVRVGTLPDPNRPHIELWNDSGCHFSIPQLAVHETAAITPVPVYWPSGSSQGSMQLNGPAEHGVVVRVIHGDPKGIAALKGFPQSELLNLDPSLLAATTDTDRASDELIQKGEGLPALLVDLSTQNPSRYQEINETLRQIVPNFRRFRVERGKTANGLPGRRVQFDFENAPNLNASQVSEGTLLCLGLMTIVHLSEGPTVLLVDELERGVHPKALKLLIDFLRKMLLAYPHLQIIATSHSPYLADHFQFDEIRLTSLDADGSAVIGSLADHPQLSQWKEQMAPGEFWSVFGESWLPGAGPSMTEANTGA